MAYRKGRLAVEAMIGLAFAVMAMYLIIKTYNSTLPLGLSLP